MSKNAQGIGYVPKYFIYILILNLTICMLLGGYKCFNPIF